MPTITAIKIGGDTYDVEGPHHDPDGSSVAIELWPRKGASGGPPVSYTVTADREPDDDRTAAYGLACDCPDFVFRHAGTASSGCKHIRAARAAGLIHPIMDRSWFDAILSR